MDYERGSAGERRLARRLGGPRRKAGEMALILLLILVAMVLGLIGAVVKGLLYLLALGVIVFVIALLIGAVRLRRAYGRPRR